MVNSLTTYLFVYLIASTIALSIQVISSASLVSKTVRLFQVFKPFRVFIQVLLSGILCFLIFWITGDKIIAFLLLIAPEYKHLTVVAIMSFLILLYVQKKERYEQLNVFGSVAFICWISLFLTITSVHFILHFELIDKAVRLFNYLTEVLPGNYKIIPYIILSTWVINIYILIYITIRRTGKIITEYLEQKIRSVYQEKIIELIYNDAYENGLPAKEQAYLKKVKRWFFTRRIFSDELLRMHEIVQGKSHERIHSYFGLLSVFDDAYNYLHHHLWYYKIKGLRIYSQLGDKTEIIYIQKLASSNNDVLRSEAQLALARLTEDENPLDYLKNQQQRLTIWEQLNLIHYFTNSQKPIGDLSGLLVSKNSSVVNFGLYCVRKFNKFEYRDQILELTKHLDIKVQDAAFEALTLYEEPEIAGYIVSRYNKALPVSTRLSIVKTLGNIGDPKAIPFLKEQLISETEEQLCLELFRSLLQIDPQEAYRNATSNPDKLLKLYDHVTDLSI